VSSDFTPVSWTFLRRLRT